MSEQQEQKEFDAEAIAKNIADKVNQSVDSKLDTFDKKIDELKPKGEPEKEEYYFAGDEEEEFLSKKDVNELMKTFDQRVDKRAKEIAESVFGAKATQNQMDVQAYNDFPMLDSNSPVYDKEFVGLVDQEMAVRESRGRDRATDPDLVYDAAAAVKARSNKWNKTALELAKDQQRVLNNQDGNFNINQKNTKTSTGPTEEQYKYGEQLGISREKLKERMARQNK